jgi:hypothetical protein
MRRRLGWGGRGAPGIEQCVTPWERGFTLAELQAMAHDSGVGVRCLRGQYFFSALQVPPWLGRTLAGWCYRRLLVPLDRWLSSRRRLDRQGAAVLCMVERLR